MTHRVHIELKRVQTWLFAVPRLRAMVGANALLGETLRDTLRKLARETAQHWTLAPVAGAYPPADPRDPLKEHDDPAVDARDGILARDGGHFEACFSRGAEAFAHAAARLLRSKLPGLRFRISIDGAERPKGSAQVLTELPVLGPCEWTGRGLASTIVKQGDDERPAVSLDVACRHEAAKRVDKGLAVDLASLLGATTKLKMLTSARELKELVGSGYLALIHADGNGVGGGAGEGDLPRTRFFHRNRVFLRRAVKAAINAHCPDDGQAPLIPLMLGGDDLLLVCRAEIALPFVVTLCEKLASFPSEGNDGFELTLGVGVVVAKHTIPIHRLHEVAEQLASSAKRRYRGLTESSLQGRSVIDWAVYSTAWVDDPVWARRRDWRCGEGDDARVLSQRPLNVLGKDLDTLQGLVRAAERIACAPRSQLRYLIDQLPRGRVLSELAFEELSTEAREALGKAGVETAWRRPSTDGPWLTELLDLVEVAEIARLGSSAERSRTEGEVAHG